MTFETFETYEASRETAEAFGPRLSDDTLEATSPDTRLAFIRSPNLQYCIANHLV